MLNQVALLFDRAAAALSPASAAAHQRGHLRLADALEIAIAALEAIATRSRRRHHGWPPPR